MSELSADRRPVLHTERIRLDPLTGEHSELLVELDSDPEVLRFIWGRALSREEVLERWLPRRLRSDAAARGIGYWAGFDTSERFLGWWALAIDDEDSDTAELGYRLRRDAWGQGYATEGSRALLAHAFTTLGLPRVWAVTMAVNSPSRRVMERLGMRHVRSHVGHWDEPLAGWEQGEVVYEITRDAFDWSVSRSRRARPGPAEDTSVGRASSSRRPGRRAAR